MTAAHLTNGYGFANRADGAVATHVGGAEVVLRASGALWLESARALVLADVHFEKGSSYAARGQMLPPYDTREALRRIALEVEALDPRAIVMLGDAFHDCEAEDRICREDADMLAAIARGRTLVWVVGNHDPSPPQSFPGHEKSGRQVTFSSDLIYDVLRRHQPDHLLLRCARADTATGMLDVARLGQLLERVKGRLRTVHLEKVSPFAVPILLTIGRESVPGVSQEWVLEEAEIEAELIAEALS